MNACLKKSKFMIEKKIISHDGFELKYSISQIQTEKPWIALIIPFGIKLWMARYFFNFFESQYNIITWESRSILNVSERKVVENEFTLENHIMDLHKVLETCSIKECTLVGYCSGAGIAMAAAARFPQLIDNLILVHGEYTLLNDSNCSTQFALEIDSLLTLAGKDERHLKLVFEKIQGDRLNSNLSRPKGVDLAFTNINFLRRYAANYLVYKEIDFESLARVITHNTLLMSGDLDVQSNVNSTQKICQFIKNSKSYIDPVADHYGLLRDESNTMVKVWNYLCEQRASYA